jgi:hypothetical protein
MNASWWIHGRCRQSGPQRLPSVRAADRRTTHVRVRPRVRLLYSTAPIWPPRSAATCGFTCRALAGEDWPERAGSPLGRTTRRPERHIAHTGGGLVTHRARAALRASGNHGTMDDAWRASAPHDPVPSTRTPMPGRWPVRAEPIAQTQAAPAAGVGRRWLPPKPVPGAGRHLQARRSVRGGSGPTPAAATAGGASSAARSEVEEGGWRRAHGVRENPRRASRSP